MDRTRQEYTTRFPAVQSQKTLMAGPANLHGTDSDCKQWTFGETLNKITHGNIKVSGA